MRCRSEEEEWALVYFRENLDAHMVKLDRRWVRWKKHDDSKTRAAILEALPNFPTVLVDVVILPCLDMTLLCPLQVIEKTPGSGISPRNHMIYQWGKRRIDPLNEVIFRRLKFCVKYFPEIFSMTYVRPLMATIRDWLLHPDQIYLWKPRNGLIGAGVGLHVAKAPQETAEQAVKSFQQLEPSAVWNGREFTMQIDEGHKLRMELESSKEQDIQWQPFKTQDNNMSIPQMNCWTIETMFCTLMIRPFLTSEILSERDLDIENHAMGFGEEILKEHVAITIFQGMNTDQLIWGILKSPYIFELHTDGHLHRRYKSMAPFSTVPLHKLFHTLESIHRTL